MISIVCVYNNEKMLNEVLLKSLDNQSVDFELITLDNRNNRFTSAAQALNYGGDKATGEYIMFVHQDMWFEENTWLENTLDTLNKLPNLGVAGVAGASSNGNSWIERCRHSIIVYDETWDIAPVTKPEEVQTLDECVLIVPQSVFSKVRFDAEIFDGWDCYGPDYCLATQALGFKSYVIPGVSRHCCLRENTRPWEFKNLFKYQKRLYKKYKSTHKTIYAWMGTLSWGALRFQDFMALVGPLYIKIFPGNDTLLKKELAGCESILDLGSGHNSPIYSVHIPFSVGVELDPAHLQESQRLGTHSEYIAADITTIEFKPNSFDAVVALDVLEHLTRDQGLQLLQKMEQWSRKKVLITASNIPLNESVKKAAYKEGQNSAWSSREFAAKGYKVHGINGWKRLRQQQTILWLVLAAITQKLVFYMHKQAVGFLVVRNKT